MQGGLISSEARTAFDGVRRGLRWLRDTYGDHRFFIERDVVWTLQRWLGDTYRGEGAPLRVYHDYPMIPGPRRSLCTDVAVLNREGRALVAVELKYEPDHARGRGIEPEIWPTKLNPSVVFWGSDGVLKDVKKCQQYIAEGRCEVAMLVFVDEGGAFRHRDPHPGTRWEDWECGGSSPRRISVLTMEEFARSGE